MYLDERSSLLLKELLSNPDVKNKDLERKYELSRRQVSYSIDKINNWLSMNHLPEIERSKNGFFLIRSEVRSFLTGKYRKETASQYIVSEKERAQLLILLMLNKEGDLSLIHFVSALQVSKNTVLTDLKTVQGLLDPYELAVAYSRQTGYDIKGNEFSKRRLLLETIQTFLNNEQGEVIFEKIIGIDQQQKQEIYLWLEHVEQTLGLTFTDEKMHQLPHILTILFKRIEQRKLIEPSFCIHYEELSDTKEYQAVELLTESKKEIPREERLFLTLNLLASNVFSCEVLTDQKVPELMRAVEKTLDLFEQNTCISLQEKENLIRLIFIHMKPAYYRIKYHLTTSNRYTEKISKEFNELHYLVQKSIKPLQDLIEEPIPESEIVYLTMFIGGWLERQGDHLHEKMRAIVVCPNGLSVSKLMKKTLQNLFPEFLFLTSLSVREFQQFKQPYDFVFSPHLLSTEKPLYVVQQFPSEEEKRQLRKRVMQDVYGYTPAALNPDDVLSIIQKYCDVKQEAKLKKELAFLLEQKQGMPQTKKNWDEEKSNLTDFLTSDVITVVSSVSDWQEAIRLAAVPLVQNGSIQPGYVEEIIRIYDYSNPYMILGNHVSIPHASSEAGVNQTAMSLLCVKEGVLFSKEFRIHLVVLIAAKDKEKHIKALFQLSKLSFDNEDVFKITNAAGKESMIQIMKKYEKEEGDYGKSNLFKRAAGRAASPV